MMADAQFAIAPDAASLGQAARTLRFHPACNPRPRRLTRAQLQQYNQRGYLTRIPVLRDAEVAAVRERFDALLSSTLAEGRDSYSISSAHLSHAQAYDLLTHPRIVDCARDILGEDVVGWGCHYFCKLPRDGKRVDWHQDSTYWPLTPSKTVTAWLAIDDADAENACMRFVAGSHLQGALPFELEENDTATVLNQRVEAAEDYGEIVDNVLRAGEISLHSDLLLHGSEANESDRRRCGLTLRYCAAEVTAYLGWNRKGVVVSGVDSRGHWANPARPAG